MNAITEFVRALGPSRLAAMGAVAAGLIGFFVFLMVYLSQPQMTVLFAELPFEDSIEIVKKLEGMDIEHEVRQDGAVILVPKEQVLRLRMSLAESGLPAGGTVGYEIFDKGDTLGATNFVQNINHLRALEGELARTIRSLDRVKFARVHLVLPQRKLFARKSSEPSASIVVSMRGGLESGQIKAIQHLASSAVEGLKPNRVSIVDEKGKLLASGRGEGSGEAITLIADERNRAFENRMQREIEEIVASVVGPDRVRVSVTAELDYNKVTETSDLYDPDGQVVRSTQTRSESSNAIQPNSDNSVSVGNELPSASDAEGSSGKTSENSNKTEEVINYEISRTTKTEIVEVGRIKRISVAVLVDGIYSKGANGEAVYAPRPQDQLDQIADLVRSAIGFDKERGDLIKVTNLRFADRALPELDDGGEKTLIDLSKDDYFNIAELVIALLIAALVLFFVIRPLVKRIITPDEVDSILSPRSKPLIAEDSQPLQIEGPDGKPVTIETDNPRYQELLEQSKKPNQMLELAKITGDVQASFVREVGEIVENNPQEAVTIVRGWLNEDVQLGDKKNGADSRPGGGPSRPARPTNA